MDDRDNRPRPGPGRRRNRGPVFPNWLYRLVVLTVLGLWVVALIVSSVAPRVFQMPPSLSSAVPVVLVAILGGKGLADANHSRRDRDEDDDE